MRVSPEALSEMVDAVGRRSRARSLLGVDVGLRALGVHMGTVRRVPDNGPGAVAPAVPPQLALPSHPLPRPAAGPRGSDS